jgi:UDP-glucose 4-epimerase
LAALISGYESLKEPDAYLRANVQGLLRVIEACRTLDRPRIVFASSSTVYGIEGDGARSESTPPRPMTMYALSKLIGEQMLEMYRELVGYDDVSLRLFNVYGPRQRPDHPYANVTCRFSHAAAHGEPVTLYGNGSQSRDFVFVTDVVDALLRVAMPAPSRIYNIGTGRDTTLLTLLDTIERIGGYRLEVARREPWLNDIRTMRADVSKMHEELGIKTETTLRDGLEHTIAWFRNTKA